MLRSLRAGGGGRDLALHMKSSTVVEKGIGQEVERDWAV
jgi:hypothetical protein